MVVVLTYWLSYEYVLQPRSALEPENAQDALLRGAGDDDPPGRGDVDVSGAAAASTSAAKLSDGCEASERDVLATAVLTVVLAGMSDGTLNTLEPLAMKLDKPVQQGVGQTERVKKIQYIQWFAAALGRAGGSRGPVISARPARFAADTWSQRDCFAGSAPILKDHGSRAVSDQPTSFGDRREPAIRKDGACEAFPRREHVA